MSREYAESRIKEALKLSGGNTIKARQQIIAWTFEDAKLLHALAKPHLSGIVAYNIERVASGRADAQKSAKPPEEKKAAPSKSNGKESKDQFGLEILKAVAGSPAIFGLEDPGAPQKKAGVSENHIKAIEAIASKKNSSD
ncbi:MAG: hypothetical protein AAF204_01470 [Pseudomonadota bacterium]